MLDPDISADDARRLLSRPADDGPVGPRGWTRRTFLQAVGAGAVAGATVGSVADGLFGGDVPEAWAGTPIGPTDGIMILITLYGGMDGLNVLVPYTDGTYYTKRANIAIPAGQVLPLNNAVGLAPQLTYLKSLYDAGQVAAVQGIGYANPDLSHFTSMAIWMNGSLAGGPISSGWVGRWLDGQPSATADLAAASLDSSVPLHMQGLVRRAAGIPPNGGMFGVDSGASDLRMYAGLRALAPAGAPANLRETFTATMRRQLDLANEVAPAFKAPLPGGGDLTRKLTMTARLINANIGLRVFDLSRGGFDNHDNQPAALPAILADLNAGLQAFYATLSPAFHDRVTIVTVSEFGRTVGSNASGGTDHGTAGTSFVIGSNVRGGLYGAMPSLTTLDRNGRMIANVDFRALYGSVIDGWLGGGGSSIVNGTFENLNLFAAAPGSSGPQPTPIVLGPSPASGFVSISPVRIFDTRDGTGGRLGALGAGETWTFPQAGRFGIPADASAVAWNLTAVGATTSTYVTVWPGGTARPSASNLNPVPGAVVPNLVQAQLGPAGSVAIYNNSGSVHLVADLVGYYTTSSTLRMQPLTPSRLIDTRDGTGGFTGKLGPGQSIDVKAFGAAGVPTNAKALALNVLATEPSANSYLTVWPSNETRPVASSLNMTAGQTVANMVFTRLSADGRLSIYNYGGATHVVADVLGAFVDNATGRMIALAPGRVLDTRSGIGVVAGRVGQSPISLKLTGVAGVPTTGVSAVLLNLTVVMPTMSTYVTVYPGGGQRPLASNLNAAPGEIVPNSVVARLGADGSVLIYNNSGTVDLVADVMGYFTT